MTKVADGGTSTSHDPKHLHDLIPQMVYRLHRKPGGLRLVEVGQVSVVVEGAGHERIEAGLSCVGGGGDKVGTRPSPKLRPDKGGGAPLVTSLLVALGKTPSCTSQFPRPWGD